MYGISDDKENRFRYVEFYDMEDGSKQKAEIRELEQDGSRLVGNFDYKDESYEVTFVIGWYEKEDRPRIMQKIRQKIWEEE